MDSKNMELMMSIAELGISNEQIALCATPIEFYRSTGLLPIQFLHEVYPIAPEHQVALNQLILIGGVMMRSIDRPQFKDQSPLTRSCLQLAKTLIEKLEPSSTFRGAVEEKKIERKAYFKEMEGMQSCDEQFFLNYIKNTYIYVFVILELAKNLSKKINVNAWVEFEQSVENFLAVWHIQQEVQKSKGLFFSGWSKIMQLRFPVDSRIRTHNIDLVLQLMNKASDHHLEQALSLSSNLNVPFYQTMLMESLRKAR